MKTLLVLFAVTSLVAFVFNLIGRQRFIDGAEPLAIPSLLFSMLLLLIGHVGLNQQFSVQDIEAEVFMESEPMAEDCGYSELLEKIRKLMSEEKLYLYPNLKVSDLAMRLNSNSSRASPLPALSTVTSRNSGASLQPPNAPSSQGVPKEWSIVRKRGVSRKETPAQS